MTFKLILYDRKGNILNEGDIVRVYRTPSEYHFYAEVKYLPEEKMIAPFHTFSFHSFEKVDKLPENAIQSTNEKYNIWYLDIPEQSDNTEHHESYLRSWRECEHCMENGCYRIEFIEPQKQMTLFS